MTDALNLMANTIAEFRANEGRVGESSRALRWSWFINAAARAGGST